MKKMRNENKIMVMVFIFVLLTAGLSGCYQKISQEKNPEEIILDSFVGTWKTFQQTKQNYSSYPSRKNYFNDSITIIFFPDRTLSWGIEETTNVIDTEDVSQNQQHFTEYTYPGYYEMKAGKFVITSYGVALYNYSFSNNSHTLTLTPLYDVPDALRWRRNQTMILTKYSEGEQQSSEGDNIKSTVLSEFFGTWNTTNYYEENNDDMAFRNNDSVNITFFANGFFSWIINRTFTSRWMEVNSSTWQSYKTNYSMSGYYELKGKKLVLTAIGVGIFSFLFTNNSHTLTMTPIYSKNLPLQGFPLEYYAQTMILKKKNETSQQNPEEQNPKENLLKVFVGTWETSGVTNDSLSNTKYHDTITVSSEGFILFFINSTVTFEGHQYNSSITIQGYYDIKAGTLVITALPVYIFNYTFSNDSHTLLLMSLFNVQQAYTGFRNETILLTRR
jgi:hypothetical protein